MNASTQNATPHPDYLNKLFAHKNTVDKVFNDVLGLYNINHVAVSQVNENNEILTFSSTPALEFNLFSSHLWQFDKTYQPSWYQTGASASWQTLYAPHHYDELYYLKQMAHHYPIGRSFAVTFENTHVIYSIASKKDTAQTHDDFINQQECFYRIGEYCSKTLLPLFISRQW